MIEMTAAQRNHLRLLLGWVRCSSGVFQSPDEYMATMRKIAPFVDPDKEGIARLAEGMHKAESVPQYVRRAIKALEPLVREDGGVIDAEQERKQLLPLMIEEQ